MIITRTPLRISFFGGGTDLPAYYLKHGGEVISTTIDKYLYITCRPMPQFWDYSNRFVYGSKTELVSDINETDHPSIRETIKFVNPGYGIDLHYNTDIPARSGMGSSSSFTVGLLNALNGMNGHMMSKERLMKDAIHIEQDLIGEAVGSQDQTAAAYGGFNHIIFNQSGEIEVYPITISSKRIKQLSDNLILVFTGFQRYAKNIEKGKIEGIGNHVDSLAKMKEYTHQALDILNSTISMDEFGALLDDNWKEKRKLSDKVSDIAIDEMYERGRKAGAIGGKLLGAGGGGFMLFYVDKEHRENLIREFSDKTCVPFSFENSGSQVIYYKEDNVPLPM
jgi:D-glycero-alpha-D-manno-heptose-7-phosphate kinase